MFGGNILCHNLNALPSLENLTLWKNHSHLINENSPVVTNKHRCFFLKITILKGINLLKDSKYLTEKLSSEEMFNYFCLLELKCLKIQALK